MGKGFSAAQASRPAPLATWQVCVRDNDDVLSSAEPAYWVKGDAITVVLRLLPRGCVVMEKGDTLKHQHGCF